MGLSSQLRSAWRPSSICVRRRADASPRLVSVIVCAGVVLASLDLFIVNVALPQMAKDLHVKGDAVADLSWILNAYAIVYASLLVLFGRLAERFPRERGFLLGVAVFVGASAACGAATSVPMLVGFRIVQAAGAALLTPTSLGLILATAPPERRQGAVRAWTAVGGLAAASWSGGRWAARRRQLAVGVPRQRSHRRRSAGGRLASPSARRRPSRAGAGCARSGAHHERGRRARAGSGQGRGLGLDRCTNARRARRGSGRDRAVLAPHRCAIETR